MTALSASRPDVPAAAAPLSGTTWLLLGIFVAVAAVIGAAIAIGPVVLTLAALVLVPVMFLFFVMISRP